MVYLKQATAQFSALPHEPNGLVQMSEVSVEYIQFLYLILWVHALNMGYQCENSRNSTMSIETLGSH